MVAGYDFRIDWDNDGSFESPGDDVTSRVLATNEPTMQYGRDQDRSLSPSASGSMSGLTLNNRSRDYSPGNLTSPLANKVKPGRPLWISYNERANLVPNPSFELSTAGWSSPSGTLSLSGQLQSGLKSGNIAITSVASTPFVESQRFPVDARKPYTVSAYGRVGVPGSRSTAVKMFFYDDAGGIVFNPSTVGTSSSAGVWTRRSATYLTIPAEATSASVVVVYPSALVSDIHQIDAVLVEATATVGTYFDGSLGGGAYWRTDSHASASLVGSVLFFGYLDDVQIDPDVMNRSIGFSGLDGLAKLRGANVSTDLWQGIRTGTAVHKILDAIGWPVGKRTIDTGSTIIPWWWEEGTDAFTALTKVVHSEGPGALVTMGTKGEIVFRDRHHRVRRTQSINVQATFRDSGAEPKHSAPLVYDAGFRDIVNQATFEILERQPGGISTVWELEELVVVTAGQPRTFTASASVPFKDALVPSAASGDMEILTGSLTATISRTSGASTEITLTSSGGASINGLRLRARPVPVARTSKVETFESVSMAEYGTRSYDQDAPWMGRHDARAVGQLILNQRSQRNSTVIARIVASPTTMATRFEPSVERDLSDRVRLIEAEIGLNADFFVERIVHTITRAGKVHEVLLGCERVPGTPLDDASTVFILDSVTNGVLDSDRLGY